MNENIVMKRNLCYIIILLLLCGIAGCKKPDYLAEQQAKSTLRNAGDFIRNNFSFSLFAAAIEKAGLMDSLNNPAAAYTIVAPQDADFNTYHITRPADLDAWGTDSIRFFVKNHLVAGKLFNSDISTSMDNRFSNLNGLPLFFSKSPVANSTAGFYINGIKVVQTDITLANGVIHVIDGLIKESNSTVQDFLASRPDMSNLVAGLKKFNLWDSLRTGNAITLFAPSNTSLSGAGLSADSIQLLDTAKYKPVLFACYALQQHHLFLNDLNLLPAANIPLPGGYQLDMSNGCAVLDAAGLVLGPNGNRVVPVVNKPSDRYTPFLGVTTNDYVFTNGIVHLLSGALVLPGDVKR